jgi:PEP-CTERM motif-containing protein
MLHFFSARRLAALLFVAAFPLTMPAAIDISLQGAFINDDNLARFSIQVLTPSSVSIRTLSYAGGTTVHGTIAGGGFDPVLSLFTGYFDPAGQQIAGSDDGGCGQVGVDSLTGHCWDAAIVNFNLLPGVYTLVLSQTGNTPAGPTFGDGFTRTGNLSYTGQDFVGINDRFWDATPSKRDGHWALDIQNVDSVAQIPEPATLAIVGIGLGALGMVRKRT